MKIPITGMTCQGCATSIQEAVAHLPGATNVSANFALKELQYENLDRELVLKTIRSLGYDSPTPRENEVFSTENIQSSQNQELKEARLQFFVAAVLGIPEFLMAMGMVPFHWPSFIDAILATLVVVVAGRDIHRRTFKFILHSQVNMDTLVTMGSLASLLKSFVLFVRGSSMPGFETASTIVVFILLGRYLEARTRRRTTSAIEELFSVFQQKVVRLNNGIEEQVLALDIQKGDTIRILAGQMVPVDGVVVNGKASISQAVATGEPTVKVAEKGSALISGTSVVDSSLVLIAKKVGRESYLGALIAELENAQSQSVPAQRLADRVTSYFVPGVIGLAALASLFHFLKGETPELAFNVFLSVLLTACPCALGLAIPTALVAGLGAAAKRGVLFREARVLEDASRITEIYFDKTGTITQGQPQLVKVIERGTITTKQLVYYAASLERHSTHPLANTIVKRADLENVFALPDPKNLRIIPGEGLEGEVVGKMVRFVRAQSAEENTASDIFIDGVLQGTFLFEDSLRPHALRILKQLKEWKFKLYLLTGDRAESVGKLNLNSYFDDVKSHLTPWDKEKLVKDAYEKNPQGVAFVGDGLNDVLALNKATVGIAVSSGAPAALSAAAVALRDGIEDIPFVFQATRLVSRQLKFNLFWAFAYNVVMLPGAALGYLDPLWSSLAMSLSSVSVVLGSLWLGWRIKKVPRFFL